MKKSCFKGSFCSKEGFVNKKNSHSKLDLESSTQAVYERQRQALKILDQVQDDCIIKRTHAFTLIELLVVVLIIGILAAVAVPQYQVAVAKSRTMSLLPLIKAIEEAEQVYFLANGEFTTDFSKLDVALPGGGISEEETLEGGTYMNKIMFNNFMCFLQDQNLPEDTYDKNNFISMLCQSVQGDAPLLEKYFNRNYYACWTNNNALAEKVCQAISGTSTHSDTSLRRGKMYKF